MLKIIILNNVIFQFPKGLFFNWTSKQVWKGSSLILTKLSNATKKGGKFSARMLGF